MAKPPSPKNNRLWKSKADFFRPFRNATSSAPSRGDYDSSLFDPDETSGLIVRDPDLEELNTALQVLSDVFPDIAPEVFREMIPRVSPESHTQLVSDFLLGKKRAHYIRGRYRSATNGPPGVKIQPPLRIEDKFRAREYEKVVLKVLSQEFNNLSKSAIRAVLAEQNHSYTLTRPILQQLASKTWKFSLSNLWPKRNTAVAVGEHPFIVWQPNVLPDRPSIPFLRRTGSIILDQELYKLFVEPIILRQRTDLLRADWKYASTVNEAEAEAASALFECECCYDTVPFERLTTCDQECHHLCFECVQRTVKEALYGQGWNRTANIKKGTVRCFSPTALDCPGSIPAPLVRRALHSNEDDTIDAWQDFESRMANETLLLTGLTLQRCPFCEYAEIAEAPPMLKKHWRDILHYSDGKASPLMLPVILIAMVGVLLFAAPVLLLVTLTWFILELFPGSKSHAAASWERVYNRRQGLRFQCLKSSCKEVSCKLCASRWRDPHTCFDNESTSLRTAIELSATAAVKRTCPRCLLSFVKSSGCNKLVCNCGYTMCYICRQEITPDEGYNHFCQHFRPDGGICVECKRCDLYGDENEEEVIRTAMLAAKQAWRDQEGGDGAGNASAQLFFERGLERTRQLTWREKFLDTVIDLLAA